MTDLLFPTSQNFVQKTLGAALNAGVTTVTLNNVTGIQNKPGVFIVDRVNTGGVETPSTREVIKFTGTSGSTLTGLTRNFDGGGSDQDHAIGAIVEFTADAMWADGVMDALENSHTSTGAVDTTKVVTLTGTQTLTNKTLTAPAISSPVLSGTATGTYTLGGTPTVTAPIIDKHSGAVTTDSDGATITMNMSVSRHQVVLGGNRILALTNLSTGQVTIVDLIQDSTGSRTLTWPSFGATATMTIATPCVVTTSKDIPTLTPVIFTTTGGLPTGVTASTVYYYVRVNATTGNISTSVANAQAGTYIASSVSQSGVHTCAVQVRWPSQTAPTLSTGKFTKDRINFYCLDATNTIVDAQVSGTIM